MNKDLHTIKEVRNKNLARVLQRIWQAKEITRADLSRELHLSRSAVSSLVEELLTAALVNESHVGESSGGRPPIVLQIDTQHRQVIGVDMGSSHIQVISTDLMGNIIHNEYVDFDCQNHPVETVQQIITLITKCQISNATIIGIGIAVPCPIDDNEMSYRILPKWKSTSLYRSLYEYFKVPIFLDNDANLGALAEKWWGLGQKNMSFVFLKIATGVGAGIINNGLLVKGNNNYAGEIGHIPVSTDPNKKCRCGLIGCFETYINSTNIRTLELQLTQNSVDTHTLILEGHDTLPAYITHYILQILIILNNILNPQKIILWSPLLQENPRYRQHLEDSLKKTNFWSPLQVEDIMLSQLGESAIAKGAMTLVLDTILQSPSLITQKQQ